MNMKQRIAVILACLVAVLTLNGCGRSETPLVIAGEVSIPAGTPRLPEKTPAPESNENRPFILALGEDAVLELEAGAGCATLSEFLKSGAAEGTSIEAWEAAEDGTLKLRFEGRWYETAEQELTDWCTVTAALREEQDN